MSNRGIYPGRQWKDRFAMYAAEFPKHYMLPAAELTINGFFTKERLSLARAQERAEQEAKPVPAGTAWGNHWEYGWFFTELVVPEELSGKRLVFVPGFGEEMLVWVNGKESGAVDKKHSHVTLSFRAEAGQVIRIAAECYAGHGPRMESGCFCAKGEKPFSDEDGPQLVMAPSFAAVWQEEIFQTAMDFLTLYSLLSRLPEGSLRAMKVTEGLKKFTYLADFELSGEALVQSLLKADQVLRPLLSCTNGSTAPEFTVFGQSHLDLAWLWTLEETRRKAARTYSNQLALMEEYPDYQFLLCEPPVLEYLKESYPALWERVKEKAAEGRMIPDGAFYVESDTNMPCGESLVRQLLYGKQWFQKEMGADSLVAWLPDCFGFSPALPQILAKSGVPYFTTQKLIRQDPECEPFPYNDFWWQGIDGTRILAHTYKENNAPISPGDMIRRWEDDRVQDEEIEGMIYSYGYGDGGGGPTRELVETAQRCRDLEGAPRAIFEGPAAYFEKLEKRGCGNVFAGELYLAWHRGTYTAQAKTKLGVRRAELLLKEAEYWNTVSAVLDRTEKSPVEKHSAAASGTETGGREEGIWIKRDEALRVLWKRLLMQEFHDVLPGTGIARVHEEAEAELSAICISCEELLDEIFRELETAQGVLGAAEEDREAGTEREKTESEGREAEPESCVRRFREGEDFLLQSDRICVRMNHAGQVLSLRVISPETGEVCREKRENTEAAAAFAEGTAAKGWEAAGELMNTFRLYRNVNSYYDAWEIGSMYEQEEELLDTAGWTMTEDTFEGRPAWRLEGAFGDSGLSQLICLSGDGRMVEFHTRMNWRERHRMLKVDFPASFRSDHVTGEVAFGAYQRPTTRSYQWEKDRYEVCGHRYSVLEDGRYGIELINDSKYGYSAKEDRISLTLLRAPLMPDMHADQGSQEFSYACFPYEGSFRQQDAAGRAERFNLDCHLSGALRARRKRLSALAPAFRLTACPEEKEACHVRMEALKLSEDGTGKPVLRLYEAAGVPQRVSVRLPKEMEAACAQETDLLERPLRSLKAENGVLTMEFKAFEIRTVVLDF